MANNPGDYYDNYGEKGKMQLKKGYSYSDANGGKEVYTQKATKGRYGRWGGGPDSYKQIPGAKGYSIYKVPKKKKEPAAAKPKPKPAVPKEQSQKIEPVKASPEIAQAKSYAQAYEKKDYSGIFKQDETDYTAKFNPSGKSDNSGGPQKDPQAFADKYKFKAAESNKQMDTTSDKPMTGADILKKDKQQYGDYM